MSSRKDVIAVVACFMAILFAASSVPARAQSNETTVIAPASITGIVTDTTGATLAGAHVHLAMTGKGARDATTKDDGSFSFNGLQPGPFRLTVDAAGFASQTIAGSLHPGEQYNAPLISLAIASANVEVRVGVSTSEIAQEQLEIEEKQRLLGVFPNFYVTYIPNAAPLTARQKFALAGRLTLDPVNFAVTGVIAGVEQATDSFHGYGQGAQGYAKRYGAATADFYSGVFIGSAILPSLLHQDPRYFVKGTGSKRSRALYAIANSVVRKGDRGHWQPDYSGILGGLAAGGISNLYYPAADRNGVALTFEGAGLGIAGTAVGNLLQEFVFRKVTSHAGRNGADSRATP